MSIIPEIVSAGPHIGSSSSSSKFSSGAIKFGNGLGSGNFGLSMFSEDSGAGCGGFDVRLKSLVDLRGGIGGAS